MKNQYIIEHEDSHERIKTSIKFTGNFDRDKIKAAILLCANIMVDGDTVEYSKNDNSKIYAGNILLMCICKKNGEVERMIMNGARAGRYVPFNYFRK